MLWSDHYTYEYQKKDNKKIISSRIMPESMPYFVFGRNDIFIVFFLLHETLVDFQALCCNMFYDFTRLLRPL